MKTTTLKAIVRAFNTASDQEHRLTLCGVLIERDGITDIVKIVATDGHCLSIQRVEDKELAHEMGEKRFFADRSNLKVLKLIEKDFSRLEECGHIIEHGKLSVGLIGQIQAHIMSIEATGYPNYQAIKFQIFFI
jgi:DNA polymerase III sliding clamp (beta) subunit (PCNA family)